MGIRLVSWFVNSREDLCELLNKCQNYSLSFVLILLKCVRRLKEDIKLHLHYDFSFWHDDFDAATKQLVEYDTEGYQQIFV